MGPSLETAAACPICGSRSGSVEPAHHVASPDRFAFCERCDLVHARDLSHPGADWYAEFPAYTGAPIDVLDAYHLAFFRITKDLRPGTLLDIGCGDGRFLAHAARRGWKPHGIDINPHLLDCARQHRGLADVARFDLQDQDAHVPWSGFAAVTAFEVLEHLPDPVGALRRIAGLLAPGGFCLVSVPRLDRFPRVFHPQIDAPPHHLTLWTPRALGSLFEAAGLPRPEIVAAPLHARELYLHYLWARSGSTQAGLKGGRFRGLGVRAGLTAVVAALNAMGKGRGHTLVAAVRGVG